MQVKFKKQAGTAYMPVQHHFLGWDEPATVKVRRFLLAEPLSGPVDLGDTLVVTPTRQAGRRLRQTLAVFCADHHTALLALRVVTPTFFLRPEGGAEANDLTVKAVWAQVLQQADLQTYPGLFPVLPPALDFTWALQMGETIRRLRDTLADGGYSLADVPGACKGKLDEPARWQDLARLETAYLAQLEALHLQDPCQAKIQRARTPACPDGIRRVVVAAVPDPTPLMIRALETLANRMLIQILIHAPSDLADRFDAWGRPIPEKWHSALVAIPEAQQNIRLCGSPAAQSRHVLDLLEAEARRFGPGRIAIGVPDNSVTPYLEADLEEKGWRTFNPAGQPFQRHPVYQLLAGIRNLFNDRTVQALYDFLRQPDVLRYLHAKQKLRPHSLLIEIDDFQACHLPLTFDDINRFFAVHPLKTERWPILAQAVAFARGQLQTLEQLPVDQAALSLLQTVYEGRMIRLRDPEDEMLIQAAELVVDTLNELDAALLEKLRITPRQAWDFLLARLGEGLIILEREDAVIDLEGWLELPWNDAPFLIATGMNEGRVPDTRPADLFLPDSLAVLLNLRHDANRYARDSYLMSALIESRRNAGRVCFLAGKTGGRGDPLQPSRLLFRCPDSELPERTRQLFSAVREPRDTAPASVSFRLDPGPPDDLPPAELDVSILPVTAFKTYLACPFRFYLSQILGMRALDIDKHGLDALDFGTLIHEALKAIARDPKLAGSEDENALSALLCAHADDWTRARYGSPLPLQITIQLESAKQRLKAAARIQAEEARQGWVIQESEVSISGLNIGGLPISGRIDRIDRHRQTGAIRILDYKTADRPVDPESAHLTSALAKRRVATDTRPYALAAVAGQTRRWIDLQLPLYRLLLSERQAQDGTAIAIGYFNLPKSLAETDITLWTKFDDALLQAARVCAEGVVQDIRARHFWPATEALPWDDFAALFSAAASDSVNAAAFQRRLRK